MKNDLEGMSKEVVVAQFEQLTHTCIKIALKLTGYYCYLLNL